MHPSSTDAARLVIAQGITHARVVGRPGQNALVAVTGKQSSKVETRGSTTRVKLGGNFPWGKSEAEIVLASEPEWDLEVSGGMSSFHADLSVLRTRSLTMSGGASNVELVLGRPVGRATVTLSGGAHHLVIRRPKDVGVRLSLRGGVAHLALDESFFSAASGKVRLETPNYASAEDRYELEISGGAHHLHVRS